MLPNLYLEALYVLKQSTTGASYFDVASQNLLSYNYYFFNKSYMNLLVIKKYTVKVEAEGNLPISKITCAHRRSMNVI